jgi:DNA invertase Pin-like site-specific DNA recombinase
MTTVDIYCRCATYDLDTFEKLEQQEMSCRDYCNKHELGIGFVHFEVAGGYTYQNRELLQLLRKRYCDGTIQGVVITNFDRLTRNHAHLADLISEMEAHGVKLHCVRENFDDSATGKIVRLIQGFTAESSY